MSDSIDLTGIEKFTGTPIERFSKWVATECQKSLVEHHLSAEVIEQLHDLRPAIAVYIQGAIEEWPKVKDQIETKEEL